MNKCVQIILDSPRGLFTLFHEVADECTLAKLLLAAEVQAWLHEHGLQAVETTVTELGQRVGIYAKRKPLDTILYAGDRVEIYRPLLCDPKEMRRQRARRKTK